MKYLFYSLLLLNIGIHCAPLPGPPHRGKIDFGLLQNGQISEVASGMVASRKNRDILWTHNDSGDTSRIFAISTRGESVATFYLAGVRARDWEDISIGPGPREGQDYIYIADIGDNVSQYENKYIYRFAEPEVTSDQKNVESNISNIEKLTIRYQDGMRDAETIMVDPLTNDIYIISKREQGVNVYALENPLFNNQMVIIDKVIVLKNLSQVTAGDISASGLNILLKTYTQIFYWRRVPGKKIWQSLERTPIILPYDKEPQGEAVTWSATETGYFTLSESLPGKPAHLYYYPFDPE